MKIGPPNNNFIQFSNFDLKIVRPQEVWKFSIFQPENKKKYLFLSKRNQLAKLVRRIVNNEKDKFNHSWKSETNNKLIFWNVKYLFCKLELRLVITQFFVQQFSFTLEVANKY